MFPLHYFQRNLDLPAIYFYKNQNLPASILNSTLPLIFSQLDSPLPQHQIFLKFPSHIWASSITLLSNTSLFGSFTSSNNFKSFAALKLDYTLLISSHFAPNNFKSCGSINHNQNGVFVCCSYHFLAQGNMVRYNMRSTRQNGILKFSSQSGKN